MFVIYTLCLVSLGLYILVVVHIIRTYSISTVHILHRSAINTVATGNLSDSTVMNIKSLNLLTIFTDSCQVVIHSHTTKQTNKHTQPNIHTHTYTHRKTGDSVTLAGFAVVCQPVPGVTCALDQSSNHLTLLGAASVILVTVVLT